LKIDWNITKLRKRDVITLLVGLYILNFLVTPMLVGEVRLESYFRPHFRQKFDSKVWNESGLIPDGRLGKPSSFYGRRYEMVDDLVASHISIGMEGKQIRAVLGDPDGGILDKKSILASPDPYGLHHSKPDKEIMESPDSIAFWAYHLSYQWQYPARSMWFPRMFANFDRWMLVIKLTNGRVSKIEVSF
jgi:hypothetical protein